MFKKIRQILIILFVIITALVPSITVLAQDYKYYVPIEVSNTGGTSYTNIPVLVPINNAQLASLGYLNENYTNSGVTEGEVDRPYSLSDTRLGFILDELGAYQSTNLRYLLDTNLEQSSFSIITGKDGYITVPDAASLEPGNNFEIELDGYIDTSAGADKNLIYKEDAFRLYVSDDGEITVDILDFAEVGWTSPTTHNLPSSAWSNPERSHDDDTSSFSQTDSIGDRSWSSYIEFPMEDLCNKIRFWARYTSSFISKVEVDVYYNNSWKSLISGSFASEQWVDLDISDVPILTTNIRVRFYNKAESSPKGRLYELQYKKFETSPVIFKVADVASGNHTIKVSADGTNLKLYIDGVLKDSVVLSSTSFLNTANDWVFCENNSMPYLNSAKISVNGSTTLWYEPVSYISDSTIIDRSGNGNNGTITWGTNYPGIELEVAGVTPWTSYVASGGKDGSVPIILPTPEGIKLFEDDSKDLSGLPMYDSFTRASSSLGWKVSTTYAVFMMFTAFGIGIAGFLAVGNIWGWVIGFGATASVAAGTGALAPWLALFVIMFAVFVAYLWRYT